jgi:hypothetical protein
MKKYNVSVVRVSYCSREIEVEASSEEEAGMLAVEKAGDYEFNEHDADYSVDDVEEITE